MRSRQLRLLLVLAGFVLAALWSRRGDRPPSATLPADPGPERPSVSTPPAPSAPQSPGARAEAASPPSRFGDRGFRSSAQLEEHFEKHGAEFGARSAAEYLGLARHLRDAPVGEDVLEATRPVDGVVSRYQRSTGAFLAFDADGTIRTFFKPNDGERYFRRQLTRRPS